VAKDRGVKQDCVEKQQQSSPFESTDHNFKKSAYQQKTQAQQTAWRCFGVSMTESIEAPSVKSCSRWPRKERNMFSVAPHGVMEGELKSKLCEIEVLIVLYALVFEELQC